MAFTSTGSRDPGDSPWGRCAARGGDLTVDPGRRLVSRLKSTPRQPLAHCHLVQDGPPPPPSQTVLPPPAAALRIALPAVCAPHGPGGICLPLHGYGGVTGAAADLLVSVLNKSTCTGLKWACSPEPRNGQSGAWMGDSQPDMASADLWPLPANWPVAWWSL